MLLAAMLRDSDDLAEISEDFCDVAPKYKIITFYETETWQKTGEPIVDQTSARLDVYGEQVVAVGADHLGVCRFADEEDMTFKSVWQEIRDVAPVSAETSPNVSTKAGGMQWEIYVEEVDQEDEGVSGLGVVRPTYAPAKAIEAAPMSSSFPWQSGGNEGKSRDSDPVLSEAPLAFRPAAAGMEERKKGAKGKRGWSFREMLGGRSGR